MGNNKKYDLEERLLQYSVDIVKFVNGIPNSRAGSLIANQLIRSGTSPYPNHGEGRAAESSKDFIHKFSICLKELREIKCWLRLLSKLDFMNSRK